MSRNSAVSLFVAAMVWLVLATVSYAEEGMIPIKSYEGKKEYTYWILTPEDLLMCLGLGGDMLTLRKDIPAQEKKLDELKEKVVNLGGAIEKKRATENLSQKDLEKINKAVDAYAKINKAHTDLLAKYNDNVDKLNESLEKYKNQCDGRKFYQEDYNAILKGEM
ncbi:MAG: hypothetical protein OEY50_01035 [Nitrospinota bacterium]|nr:hypothetical protein [Nitrospinota bacterium]MDH5679335.1 hypothetical protein [Nitrospinota bacterium]